MLNAIRRDVDAQAQATVGLAGVLFDEYMRNRGDQLLTTVNVLVSDYGFKQAVAGGDQATIRSALINHAGRVGATVAALLDLDGAVIGELRARNRARSARASRRCRTANRWRASVIASCISAVCRIRR